MALTTTDLLFLTYRTLSAVKPLRILYITGDLA
jgi:hypothetical protein